MLFTVLIWCIGSISPAKKVGIIMILIHSVVITKVDSLSIASSISRTEVGLVLNSTSAFLQIFLELLLSLSLLFGSFGTGKTKTSFLAAKVTVFGFKFQSKEVSYGYSS